jgi:hypothetical protein
MINIRLPNITGKTEAEQLAQIKSYLYQFAGQLQFALSTVETVGGSNVVAQRSSAFGEPAKEDPVSTFNQLKGLIIKSAEIVHAYYEKIDSLLKLSGDYTAISEFGTFKEQTLNSISVSASKMSLFLPERVA